MVGSTVVSPTRFSSRLKNKTKSKSFRQNYFKYLFLLSNTLILAGVFVFIVLNSKMSSAAQFNNASPSNAIVNPLDQLSSANIALNIANTVRLPEATAISNQAQSQAAELAMASLSNSIISKPQIVNTALKSRANIFYYTTKAGDTVSALATKFGITSNSILWSNNLTGNTLNAGEKLVIPPITGLVYKVKPGDTTQSVAKKFNVSQAQVIAYNDAEIAGIHPGELILIPNGTKQTPIYNSYSSYNSSSAAFPWGGNSAVYGSNGYDFGWCTWYVATQISIPSNWGNANTWAYYAARSGWQVSSTPVVGAIAQTPYAYFGEGHVAIVRAINPNGTIWVSEMNSYGQKSMTNSTPTGGWDVVDWKVVPISSYPNYIYR